MVKGVKKTREQFLKEAHEIYGKETYDYSDFIFKNYSTKGKIKCKELGHKPFNKTPNEHINKQQECPKCSHKRRYANSFKRQFETNDDYWRALKRRQAGMSKEKILNPDYVRSDKETTPLKVNGITYSNLTKACKALKPIASITTIKRWLDKGLKPDEVFNRVPNPGYSAGIIYLVTNKTTSKQYIGLSIETLKDRWNGHIDSAKKGEYTNKYSLQTAIRKYGKKDFLIEEIDTGTSLDDLEDKEKYWIEKLETLFPNGFNLNKGGSGGGSNTKPIILDGKKFKSRKEATKYVSETRGVSIEAGKWRIRHNKIDVQKPSKPGEGIYKTKSYKAWSHIKHCTVNPKSKSYIPGIKLFKEWENSSTFREDVGEPEDPSFVFARIDKSKDITPENCRWMSRSEANSLNAKWQHKKRNKPNKY